MNPIAVFYESTTVYYSSIMLVMALVSAFVFGLAVYVSNHKYTFAFWLYAPAATILSIFVSRAIHWYCNMESYESFRSAITDYETGYFCISGVLVGIWLPALILQLVRAVKSRFEILDAAVPGIAFVIAIVRFSHIFNEFCRGKMIESDERFQHLPFSSPVIANDGSVEYRFATFFVSFLVLLAISIVLAVYIRISSISGKIKTGSGHAFRLFLLLFSAEEVIMDSTRYDASHLFFSGEQFAEINKGTSFMGLSQFISALIIVGLFVYYLVSAIKAKIKSKKYPILLSVLLFVVGIGSAGTCEYLVQRFTGMYRLIYAGQLLGLVMLSAGIILLYKRKTAK